MITVEELISELQKLPRHLPVYMADWNEQYAPDHEVSDISVKPAGPQSWGANTRVDQPERVVLE